MACPCLWYRFNETFQWLKTFSYLLMSFCYFIFKMGFFRNASNNWLEVFLKFSYYSQENICVRVLKTKGMKKRDSQLRCFPVNIAKFLRKDFYWNILVDCSKVDAHESYRKCKLNSDFLECSDKETAVFFILLKQTFVL